MHKNPLSVLLRFLGALPLPMRRWIGRTLGSLFSLLPLRERAIVELQLKRCNLLPPDGLGAKRVFAHFGEALMEVTNVEQLVPLVKASPEVLTLFEPRAKATLVLTGHLGNWDLLGAFAVSRGIPLWTIARPVRSRIAHDAMCAIRDAYGIRTIQRGDSARELVQLFRQPVVVAALVDQDTEVSSAFVDFFGIPAKTPIALVEIALRTEAEILACFITREEDGTFTVHADRCEDRRSAIAVLEWYSGILERLLCAYPFQWPWFHKRWKSRPSGEVVRTPEYIKWLRDETP